MPIIGRCKRSKHWHKSYIRKIIQNRALIGEYQPHTGHVGNRKPTGQPIAGLFSADNFRQRFSQNAKRWVEKTHADGSATNRICSAVFCSMPAASTLNMVRTTERSNRNWSTQPRLRGNLERFTCGFPYNEFEQTFLRYLPEIRLEDLTVVSDPSQIETIEDHQNRLIDLDKRLEKINERIATDELGQLGGLMTTVAKSRKIAMPPWKRWKN